jgi:hypothetical protein
VVPMKDRTNHDLPVFHVQPAAWVKDSYRAVLLVEAIPPVLRAAKANSVKEDWERAKRAVRTRFRTRPSPPVFRANHVLRGKESGYFAAVSRTRSALHARRVSSAPVVRVFVRHVRQVITAPLEQHNHDRAQKAVSVATLPRFQGRIDLGSNGNIL